MNEVGYRKGIVKTSAQLTWIGLVASRRLRGRLSRQCPAGNETGPDAQRGRAVLRRQHNRPVVLRLSHRSIGTDQHVWLWLVDLHGRRWRRKALSMDVLRLKLRVKLRLGEVAVAFARLRWDALVLKCNRQPTAAWLRPVDALLVDTQNDAVFDVTQVLQLIEHVL